MQFPDFMFRDKNKIHAFGEARVLPGEIVPYRDAMKESVLAFLSEAFVAAGKVFEAEGRHKIYTDIPNNFLLFLCMKQQEKVIGTVALKKLSEKTCELKTLYLLKAWQGKKLGYALASSAIDFAKENGFEKIYLDSMKGYDKAIRLYRSLGFKECERYNDNDKADVFMVKELAISK